ncbi:hypothetical protein [Chitinophaga sp. CF418]|uniref:hypothetical protein n=1 Tax=Chitinophaga sp. CF418 TaxID=1855287 RepID=UPI00091B7F7A|nr:hypothetical protein [Chitinophaga sp. CF418]SHN18671.1 hypothetical protein SAMN05216311_106233 [Chitinophaga sp. CF418]
MTQNSKLFLTGLFIAGGMFLASCGGGSRTNTDSTSIGGPDTAAVTPDTASAEMPPGAINPGEDSSRYGTGTGDSSRNRNPK